MSRDPQVIEREIEQARDRLAATVEELSMRVAPETLTEKAKATLREKAQSPAGKAVIGVAAGLTFLLVIKRFRDRR
ncbi:MAG: DUF3618 domain-containing protein [Mycobacteriales bacterium]